MNISRASLARYAKCCAQLKNANCEKYLSSDGISKVA